MVLWFLNDHARLAHERKRIEELLASADWLIGANWGVHQGCLCIDAVIKVHDREYELRAIYPQLFPDTPIIVKSNSGARISTHQYNDGSLCLEWRPDNWQSHVTGADMLESAFHLLNIENPSGSNAPLVPIIAPSAHSLVIGQELRSAVVRWFHNEALQSAFRSQNLHTSGAFKYTFRKEGECFVTLVHEVTTPGMETWKDQTIPITMRGAEPKNYQPGIWVKTDLDGGLLEKAASFEELKGLLKDVPTEKIIGLGRTLSGDNSSNELEAALVIDKNENLHLFILVSKESFIRCTVLKAQPTQDTNGIREAMNVQGKRVGIVGLGSAGSKIAVSLARMGIRSFYIIDYDVLFPENLRRHALDWQGISQHKVDGVKAAIHLITPEATVEISRLHLTGQESSPAVNGALKKLSDCDITIDATANPKVFNLLSAVSRASKKSLVWFEVFGGGIGGLIARSRPEVDRSPQDMRNMYLQFCIEHPHDAQQKSIGNYEVENEEGKVLAATDADVGIIAHHVARLGIDCLGNVEQSKYPYSMYLLGFEKAWIFEAPFATIPINTGVHEESSGEPMSDEALNEVFTFLTNILTKK